MSTSPFSIEIHESDYVIFFKDQIIAAFGSVEDAFQAKYDFETRPHISADDKIPPAICWQKQQFAANNVWLT